MKLLKTQKGKIIAGLATLFVLAAIVGVVLWTNRGYRSIVVDSLKGSTTVTNGKASRDATEGQKLKNQDEVTVGEKSRLVLALDTDKHVSADELTHFFVEAVGAAGKDSKTVIRLDQGSILNKIDNQLKDDESYTVDTPNASMAVRGTKFRVTVTYENGICHTLIEVEKGVVEVTDKETGQTYELTAGESLEIISGTENGEIVANVPTPTEGPTEGGGSAPTTPEGWQMPGTSGFGLAELDKARVGDTVRFGSYEQDANPANGTEEIEWIVLNAQKDKVLLLSKYIIDAKAYDEEDKTWFACTLRNWLNHDFYNTAFTDTEQKYIRQVTLDNPDNPYFRDESGAVFGYSTTDKVFLLSLDELKQYFRFTNDEGEIWTNDNDKRLVAYGTPQAYENHLLLYYDFDGTRTLHKTTGEEYSPTTTGMWWLRSPGVASDNTAIVLWDGRADLAGMGKNNDNVGVRPAIWLNLEPDTAPEPTPDTGSGKVADLQNATVGDTVIFGAYEQDEDTENGAEAIEWFVLDVQADKLLLLSKDILEYLPYNKMKTGSTKIEPTTWETCTLRNWLNEEFYNIAFTEEERGYIRKAALENPDNPQYGTPGGVATKDHVFLLSYDEVKTYFSPEEYEAKTWDFGKATKLRAYVTRHAFEHANANNILIYNLETDTKYANDAYWAEIQEAVVGYAPACYGTWWLRSPGSSRLGAMYVFENGTVSLNGLSGNNEYGIRPALWLNLEPDTEPEPTPTPELTATPEPTPTPELTATPEPTATPKPSEGELSDIGKAKVGDTVKFGSYEQDAIEWYVLDKQEDKALLFSKDIITAKSYNEEWVNITWATCTLRNWLNDDFYNMAFTDTEKGYIRQVTLTNPDNPYYGTAGGNTTQDRVFLLSLDELRKYFSFGEDHGDWWEYNGDTRLLVQDRVVWWWLRSPGFNSGAATAVDHVGCARTDGTPVTDGSGFVRPALWLNLNPEK